MDDKVRDTSVATCLDGLVQRHREGTRLGDSAVARGLGAGSMGHVRTSVWPRGA